LVQVVNELVEVGFDDIIVVNDGSSIEYIQHFEEIEKLPGCTVLTHKNNMGKGTALKTAFTFLIENRTVKAGVVTMDGDGQHRTADVVRCAQALTVPGDSVIMGVRDFKSSGVPRINAFGNTISVLTFRFVFGIKLRDTQTGLRGIRTQHIPMMLKIHGNRFEYETNMLIEIEKNGIEFQEVDIETVYTKGSGKHSHHSHFRLFSDSVAIYLRIIKYAFSSIISFLVDIGLFWIAIMFLSSMLGTLAIPASTAFARVCSSFLNFNFNRRLVFKQKKTFSRQIQKYYILATVQMSVSATILWIVAHLSDFGYSAIVLAFFKIIIDTALFFISYYIQRKWVFR
jgi:putative flippase GtrA